MPQVLKCRFKIRGDVEGLTEGCGSAGGAPELRMFRVIVRRNLLKAARNRFAAKVFG